MKTILCPIDFSPSAQAGLQYAKTLALLTQTRLVLVHAIPKHSVRLESVDQELVAQARHKLREIKVALLEQGVSEALLSTQVVNLFPLHSVVRNLARAQNASLIIMGMGEARGILKSLMRSSAVEVLERVDCPVLVIPEKRRFTPLQRILVATDLKRALPADMQLVVEMAQLFGAEITFLLVLVDSKDRAREQAREQLSVISKQIEYPNVSNHLLEHENIEEGIKQFAAGLEADLLVVTTHPHTFWQRLFESSHTEQLTDGMDIPLLALHAKRFEEGT